MTAPVAPGADAVTGATGDGATSPAGPDRMFVVLVHYIRPFAEVEAHTAAHRAFLETLYARGLLLGSGRRVPPVGGVILVRGGELAKVEALFAADPFVVAGVAHYEFILFEPGASPRRSPELDAFLKR